MPVAVGEGVAVGAEVGSGSAGVLVGVGVVVLVWVGVGVAVFAGVGLEVAVFVGVELGVTVLV